MSELVKALLEPTKRDLAISLLDRIKRYEESVEGTEQAEILLKEELINGLYRRTIKIPEGTRCTGAMHKKPHFDTLVSGRMIVATETGNKTIDGPSQYTTGIGHKKFGTALTDVIWSTVHATDALTTEEAYKDLHCTTDAEEDFYSMVAELGVDPATVRIQSEYAGDRIYHLPINMQVRDSSIEGQGVHAIKDIPEGEVYEARSKEGFRLDLGRYTNHSSNPNCEMFLSKDIIAMITLRPIVAGEELTIDYRVSVQVAKESSKCQE